VEEAAHSPRLIRFGTFEVDLPAGELRKSGLKLKLTGQPFQVLAILLERPGDVVSREELQNRLWPNTFVDVDHNLNTAVNKIREALGDSAENPRFVETLPRRGYRFIAPLANRGNPRASDGGTIPSAPPAEEAGSGVSRESLVGPRALPNVILFAAVVLLGAAAFFIYQKLHSSRLSPMQRALTRLTFDDGLQVGATWSPDGRFVAYSSDRRGKFDIWVQQVSGGDPVQVTHSPGHNWQPDWSPDGKYIAYRSEGGEGGLFIIPALADFYFQFWQRGRPCGPPLCRPLPVALFAYHRFLKYACHRGVYGDACCRDYADDMGEELVAVCRRIVCIQGKPPGIVVSVSTQDDMFNDLGGSPRGPDYGRVGRIDNVAVSKVIELVFGSSGLFPDPQTDIAVLRRPSGVHDFRSIAVPLDEARVYWRAVRYVGFVAFGGKRHLPEPHDRVVGVLFGHK
jgi:DNA-binding winged helix-turn-helix (wHTH) protein